jgi:hypothetical protein
MLRALAITALFALALPTLAAAQGTAPQNHGRAGGAPRAAPGPGPRVGGPPPGRTFVAPRGPMGHPGPVVGPGPRLRPGPGPRLGPGPGPGATAGHFMFRGHPFVGVHAAPYAYPAGYGYQRWAAGGILPSLFLAPTYYYTDWATLGLDPPPPGFQWVRYGPDLLMVNVETGQVVDVAYGVFY